MLPLVIGAQPRELRVTTENAGMTNKHVWKYMFVTIRSIDFHYLESDQKLIT